MGNSCCTPTFELESERGNLRFGADSADINGISLQGRSAAISVMPEADGTNRPRVHRNREADKQVNRRASFGVEHEFDNGSTLALAYRTEMNRDYLDVQGATLSYSMPF